MSINDFVCKASETALAKRDNSSDTNIRENALRNCFLASQYYVNGSPWSTERLQQMAETPGTQEYEIKNGQLSFTVPAGEEAGGEHSDRLPNGWDTREADWEYLEDELSD